MGRHRRRRRLSIGTNHLIHCIRRNLDVNILLFNNRNLRPDQGPILADLGIRQKTKSSPLGTIEQPIRPIDIALAAEATFVAALSSPIRRISPGVIEAAARHKGTAFIEILQNCVVFNDNVLASFTDRSLREENWVYLEHGKPIRFGKDLAKGLVLRGTSRWWPWSAKTACARRTYGARRPRSSSAMASSWPVLARPWPRPRWVFSARSKSRPTMIC